MYVRWYVNERCIVMKLSPMIGLDSEPSLKDSNDLSSPLISQAFLFIPNFIQDCQASLVVTGFEASLTFQHG